MDGRSRIEHRAETDGVPSLPEPHDTRCAGIEGAITHPNTAVPAQTRTCMPPNTVLAMLNRGAVGDVLERPTPTSGKTRVGSSGCTAAAVTLLGKAPAEPATIFRTIAASKPRPSTSIVMSIRYGRPGNAVSARYSSVRPGVTARRIALLSEVYPMTGPRSN